MTSASRACCLLAVVFLGACASRESYRPESEVVAEWLSARPRALALEVQDSLPEARVRTRDPQTAKKLVMVPGGAIAGVAMGIWEGCTAGGLFGCVVGVVISPVTAVAGAGMGYGSVKPIDKFDAPADVPGAPRLFEALRGPRAAPAALLRDSFQQAARKAGKHNLVTDSSAAEGELAIRFTDAMFSRDVGDQSKLGLVLGLQVEVRARIDDALRSASWPFYTYEGTRRPVAEWMADDALKLREELALGAAALATQVIAGLDRAPPKAGSLVGARSARGSSGGYSYYPKLTKNFVTLGDTEAVPPLPAGALVLLEHTIAIRTERQRAAWIAVNLAEPAAAQGRSFSALLVVDCPAGSLEVSNAAISTERNGDGFVQSFEAYEPARQIAAPSAQLLDARSRICAKPDPYRTTRP